MSPVAVAGTISGWSVHQFVRAVDDLQQRGALRQWAFYTGLAAHRSPLNALVELQCDWLRAHAGGEPPDQPVEGFTLCYMYINRWFDHLFRTMT